MPVYISHPAQLWVSRIDNNSSIGVETSSEKKLSKVQLTVVVIYVTGFSNPFINILDFNALKLLESTMQNEKHDFVFSKGLTCLKTWF